MKIFLILLFIIPFDSKADAVTRAAFKYAQRALFAYPAPKKLRKSAERYVFSLLPVEKENVIMVGGIGYALASGSISTKNFNNLRFGVMGWNVSPELNFNFRNNEMFSLISINKEF